METKDTMKPSDHVRGQIVDAETGEVVGDTEKEVEKKEKKDEPKK